MSQEEKGKKKEERRRKKEEGEGRRRRKRKRRKERSSRCVDSIIQKHDCDSPVRLMHGAEWSCLTSLDDEEGFMLATVRISAGLLKEFVLAKNHQSAIAPLDMPPSHQQALI